MDLKYPIIRKIISDKNLDKMLDIIKLLTDLEQEMIDFRFDICYSKKLSFIDAYIRHAYNLKSYELADQLNISKSYWYMFIGGRELPKGIAPIKYKTLLKLFQLSPTVVDYPECNFISIFDKKIEKDNKLE